MVTVKREGRVLARNSSFFKLFHSELIANEDEQRLATSSVVPVAAAAQSQQLNVEAAQAATPQLPTPAADTEARQSDHGEDEPATVANEQRAPGKGGRPTKAQSILNQQRREQLHAEKEASYTNVRRSDRKKPVV